MRLLICHPGADWATADIHDGYVSAFKALGHEVGVYNLSVRIMRAHGWLNYCWRQAGRPEGKPTQADVIRTASADVATSALRGDVDWVLVITGAYLDPDALILLRRAGKRVALLLTESPYEDDRQIRATQYADVVFTNERTSVDHLRNMNPYVYYLAHAYDPEKHHPAAADASVPAHDVVFVGTGFQERLDILSAVDWSGIDLGLYGSYELLGSRSKLRQYIKGGVTDNAQAGRLYRSAKIGLNLYRQSVEYSRTAPRIRGAESMNPRALELAASGVFTISDYRAEVAEVFGELLPTFGRKLCFAHTRTSSRGCPSRRGCQAKLDGQELGGLIRRYLAAYKSRTDMAEQLPARVARSTFRHRAEQVSRLLMGVRTEIIGYDGHTGESPAGAALGTRAACLVGV